MLAAYAIAPHPDEPLTGLRLGQRPDPDVPAGWVPVHVTAASLNLHDIWTLRGVGISPDQFPMILGSDAAGLASDGTPVVIYPVIGKPGWVGDETLDPQRTLLTEKHQGTLAETVIVPARNAVPLPAGMDTHHAAVLGTAWLTAYRMLFIKSGLAPGDVALVQGASGGVSTALIQLGAAAGIRMWVTGRSPESRQLAQELGADATFEPGARLPTKVDAVFESVGAATWDHSMKAVRAGGAVICCGATSGPNPPADLQRLFFRQIRVEGSTLGTREEFADLIDFVQSRAITPQIGLTVPLTEVHGAFGALLAGRSRGKIVVSVT